ncbi:MAG TPA: SRPBCC family protein [Candidatus Limnocylindrales bacterium]|nr:SRPBCC family protein [Candidatus Limnocylindrales bacterium]
MIRFANTIDIGRPTDHVYAYLADLRHTPEWNWAIADAEIVGPEPAGVGARYRFRRTAPRPGTEVVEITGLEPGRRIDVAGRLGPFDAHLTYELAETRTGTRLTNAVELEPPVPLGPFGDVLGGTIRASVRENLGVLKGVLEAGG